MSSAADPADSSLRTLLARSWHAVPARGWLALVLGYAATTYLNIVQRTQWGPDSRFYLSWTYWYLGHTKQQALDLTYPFLEKQAGTGCPRCFDHGVDFLFSGNGAAVVGPRVVTPGVSAPFVALFGPWGMIVPNIAFYLGAIIVLVAMVSRLYGRSWAMVAGGLMLATGWVSRWGAMTYTEAPALFFTIAAVALLPLARRTGRRHLVGYLLLLEAGLFTRQFAVAIPVAVALTWLLVAIRDRRLRNPWLAFAVGGGVLGVATVYVQSRLVPLQQSLYARYEQFTGARTPLESLQAVPHVLRVIVRTDFSTVSSDVPLIAVCLAALVSALIRFRSETSALIVGLTLPTVALNIINTVPSLFRYYAPLFPVYVLGAVALLACLADRRVPRDERVPTAPPPAADPEPGQGPRRPRRLLAGLRTLLPRRGWAVLGVLYVYVLGAGYYAQRQYDATSQVHLGLVYRLLGYSAATAAGRAHDDLRPVLPGLPDAARLFDQAPAHRVLTHPLGDLLSAPFVAVLGVRGLLVVPALSLAVIAGGLALLARRRWGAGPALAVGVAVLLGFRLVRWATLAEPELLAGALAVLVLFTLPRQAPDRPPPGHPVVRGVLLAVLLAAGLLTAPSFLAVPAGIVLAYLARAVTGRRALDSWLGAAVLSVLLVVASLVLGRHPVSSLGLNGLSAPSPAGLVGSRLHDAVVMLAADRIACAAVLLSIAAVVLRPRSSLSWLALGAGLTAVLLSLAEGPTAGSAPYLAALPLMLLSSAAVLATAAGRVRPRVRARPSSAGEQPTDDLPVAGHDVVEQAGTGR